MNSMTVTFGLSAMMLGTVLAGCAPSAQEGVVNVEVRAAAPGVEGGVHMITVSGAEGEVIDTRELAEHSSLFLASVPFGEIKIDVSDSCVVESDLNSDRPSMRLIIDGSNCTLTD